MPIPDLNPTSVQSPFPAFRVVKCGDPADTAALTECFKSNYALGRPARGPERANEVIWRGVSMYESVDGASAVSRSYPVLGSFVAEVRLLPDSGITYCFWGSAGHMSVWADPAVLVANIADIVKVEDL